MYVLFLGTLLRNGPGLFEFKDQKADHAFDGMAMIRRYHVDKPSNINQTSPDMIVSRRLIQRHIAAMIPHYDNKGIHLHSQFPHNLLTM